MVNSFTAGPQKRTPRSGRRRRRAVCASTWKVSGFLAVLLLAAAAHAQTPKPAASLKIGVTLHKRLGPRDWQVFMRNAKRVRTGDIIDFAAGVQAQAGARDEDGGMAIAFLGEEPVEILLERAGQMPLPPYIASKRPTDAQDRADYQTMFARDAGAVAAPTAALHFDEGVLSGLEARGVHRANVTLHVGAGTFAPMKTERIEEHVMHHERYAIPPATVQAIEDCRARGGRVVAVGTTTVRTLESWAKTGELQGDTNIFITPGFEFLVVDVLVTNFHLPKSTLMMLVSAFAGYEHVMALYRHAVAQGYRFFSYGDAMLLARSTAAATGRP